MRAVILVIILLLGASLIALLVVPPERTVIVVAGAIVFAVSGGFTLYYLRFQMGQRAEPTKREHTQENAPGHQAVLQEGLKSRGGPKPTSTDQQQEIIEGWLEAQKRGESQEAYCARVGVGASTLRGWMRKMNRDLS